MNNTSQLEVSPTQEKTSPVVNTPAPKRGRAELQKTIYDNICKTPRLPNIDSPFRLLQLLDSRFEKQTEALTKLMKTLVMESEHRILSKIEQIEDNMIELKKSLIDVTTRVSKLESVSDEITSLKSDLNELKLQHLRQENSLVACDLRINGIPFYDDEDLPGIFDDICHTLDIKTPSVKAIYRLQNRNNKNRNNSPDAVIIVKLMSPYDKNFLLKSLAGFRKANRCSLMLKHIGFKSGNSERYKSDDPIYINENLTSTNYSIFISALRLKRSNHLRSVFTMRGLVYVKNDNTEQPVRIDNLQQLNEFFLPANNVPHSNDSFNMYSNKTSQ